MYTEASRGCHKESYGKQAGRDRIKGGLKQMEWMQKMSRYEVENWKYRFCRDREEEVVAGNLNLRLVTGNLNLRPTPSALLQKLTSNKFHVKCAAKMKNIAI